MTWPSRGEHPGGNISPHLPKGVLNPVIDLIATGADGRTDRSMDPPGIRPPGRQLPYRLCRNPERGAPPSGVDCPDGSNIGGKQQDRHTISGEDCEDQSGFPGNKTIGVVHGILRIPHSPARMVG
jgi:hypothetical protein